MKKEFMKDHIMQVDELNLDYDNFKLFLDLEKAYDSKSLAQYKHLASEIIKRAEIQLTRDYPTLLATTYMEFKRNGNRSNYESLYFKRREMVLDLLLAEYYEKENRFTDKLLDGVWLILEETTWVLPAHNGHKPHSSIEAPLAYKYADDIDYTDLFSAETGALLAWVYYLGEDILDPISPLIRERIYYELNRKIIKPFFDQDQWWTSLRGKHVNNWNPWIVSNCLIVCSLTIKEEDTRKDFLKKAMLMLDGFTRSVPADGGCDEGPSYWTVAAAAYFDSLELIYDITGGRLDFFDNPLVKNLMEYIMHAHVEDDFFLNFADSPARLSLDYILVARMARRIKSEKLLDFAKRQGKDRKLLQGSTLTYRKIKSFFDQIEGTSNDKASFDSCLPDLGIMVFREADSVIGIKGGHNGEGHNHNDVGNMIVFVNRKALLIDVGVETYKRETFSSERYKIWTMNSDYHNLPRICGQKQKAGGARRATETDYDLKKRSFKAQLKEAYDIDCLDSYTRQARMLTGGRIQITDYIKLKEEGQVVFNLMTPYLPEIRDNFLVFENAIIEFDKSLSVNIESIKLDDKNLYSTWRQDYLYRILLSIEKRKEGEFLLDIRPKNLVD